METLFSKANILIQYILEPDHNGCTFLMEKDEQRRAEGSSRTKKACCLLWVFVLILQVQSFLIRRELSTIKLELLELRNFKAEKRIFFKRSTEESDAVKIVSGVDAVHLHPTFPFQKIENDGRVGPWSSPPLENAFITLKANNTEVELTAEGIYHVYAQIYYLTNRYSNSYHIVTYNGTEERERHRTLSTCACQGRNVIGEVSCYTGFTGTFNLGDRIYLHQIEQNRIINNSRGSSFFGVVLLRKIDDNPKRKT